MAQVLVSYLMNSRRSLPYGLRIWDDGRLESFDTTHETVDERGGVKSRQVQPGWYELGELNVKQLDQIKQAIAAIDFAAMPRVITTDDTLHSDPTASEWVIRTSTGPVNIKIPQWAPLPDGAEPLAKLVNVISHVVSADVIFDDEDDE